MLPDDQSSDAVFDESAALEEIDLYAELVIAAQASPGPLSTAEIDAALGLGTTERS